MTNFIKFLVFLIPLRFLLTYKQLQQWQHNSLLPQQHPNNFCYFFPKQQILIKNFVEKITCSNWGEFYLKCNILCLCSSTIFSVATCSKTCWKHSHIFFIFIIKNWTIVEQDYWYVRHQQHKVATIATYVYEMFYQDNVIEFSMFIFIS